MPLLASDLLKTSGRRLLQRSPPPYTIQGTSAPHALALWLPALKTRNGNNAAVPGARGYTEEGCRSLALL